MSECFRAVLIYCVCANIMHVCVYIYVYMCVCISRSKVCISHANLTFARNLEVKFLGAIANQFKKKGLP